MTTGLSKNKIIDLIISRLTMLCEDFPDCTGEEISEAIKMEIEAYQDFKDEE